MGMKAVEWAGKFQAATSDEEMALVFEEFGTEIAELIGLRTKGSNSLTRLSAAEGAVKEQRQKFVAMKSRVPSLTDEQFEAIVDKMCPEFRQWQGEAKKKAEQQKKLEDAKGGAGDGRTFANRNTQGRGGQGNNQRGGKPQGGKPMAGPGQKNSVGAPRRPAPRGR